MKLTTNFAEKIRIADNIRDDQDQFAGFCGIKDVTMERNIIIRRHEPTCALLWGAVENLIFRDNVVYSTQGHVRNRKSRDQKNMTRSGDLYFSPDNVPLSEFLLSEPETGESCADPLFRHVPRDDFALSAGSPAIIC